jgi:glycerol kinase
LIMAVLAIDQGTSGTKAVVVGDDGAVLGIAEQPVRPTYLPGGRIEQDPSQLLTSVLDAGRRAVAAACQPVSAVSVANHGETVLAWDPDTGTPLSTALVWQDRRAEALCRSKSHAKAWVAQRTGLVLDPYFSAPKIGVGNVGEPDADHRDRSRLRPDGRDLVLPARHQARHGNASAGERS